MTTLRRMIMMTAAASQGVQAPTPGKGGSEAGRGTVPALERVPAGDAQAVLDEEFPENDFLEQSPRGVSNAFSLAFLMQSPMFRGSSLPESPVPCKVFQPLFATPVRNLPPSPAIHISSEEANTLICELSAQPSSPSGRKRRAVVLVEEDLCEIRKNDMESAETYEAGGGKKTRSRHVNRIRGKPFDCSDMNKRQRLFSDINAWVKTNSRKVDETMRFSMPPPQSLYGNENASIFANDRFLRSSGSLDFPERKRVPVDASFPLRKDAAPRSLRKSSFHATS